MPIPDTVARLIEKFRDNADHYRSPAYNEETCRVDFINPMFEALGWDMANRAGYADAYRDVIHEDALRVGGSVTAPEPAFQPRQRLLGRVSERRLERPSPIARKMACSRYTGNRD